MKFAYHSVILSNAKDLVTSTLCIQILHFVQNDTTKKVDVTLITPTFLMSSP